MKVNFATVILAAALAVTACKKKDNAAPSSGGNAPGSAGSATTQPVATPTGSGSDTTATGSGSGSSQPTATTGSGSGSDTAAAGPADGTAFAYVAPAVGSKKQVSDELNMTLEVTTPDGKKLTGSQQTVLGYDLEVIASKTFVEKVKLTFTTAKVTRKGAVFKADDKGTTLSEPVEGKSYLVEAVNGVIKVTTEAGAEVSDAESKLVAKKADNDLGKIPGMPQVIASRKWKIGDKVTLTPDLLSMLANTEGLRATSGAVVLTAIDGDIASFEIEMAAEIDQPGRKFTLPAMKMHAKADAKTLNAGEVTMETAVTGDMAGAKISGSLTGKKTNKTL